MSQFYTRPAEKFPPGVKNLIAINVVVWVAQVIYDRMYSDADIFSGGFLTGKLALWPIGDSHFRPWQIITHMFAHAASGPLMFVHILFNMFALWMFGRILENIWGTKRFVIFYLICGLGSAALHLLMQYLTGSGEPAVGASGAVFGILVAFGMIFPNTELMVMFIPFPVKAKWVVLAFIAIDLFGGISRTSGDNTAHFAHLGGALTGFLLLKIQNRNNRRTFY